MIRYLLAAVGAAAVAFTPLPAVGVSLPPYPPTDVVAVPGNASATVSWQASKDPNDVPIHHYDVTADPGPAMCQTPDGTVTTCTVTGLSNGTSYTFTVTATNEEKRTSEPSEASLPVVPYTVPDPPTLASVWPSDQALRASWWVSGDGGSPLLDYTATAQPGGNSCTVPADQTYCYIGGLTNGTSYSVTVRARNQAGFSTPSNALSNSPYGAPGLATEVTVVAGEHSAAVSWVAPTYDGGRPLARFSVQTEGRDCAAALPATSCTLTGLVAGREYRFRVLTYNTGNASSITAYSAPVVPTGTAGGPGGGPTLVGWGGNMAGQLGDGTWGATTWSPAPAYLGTGLTDKDVVEVSAGYEHACALDAAGGVYCWGTGVFTDGSTQSYTAIPQAGLPGPASDIAAGLDFTCALVSGRAYCWGDGSHGQLGAGSTTRSATPVAVRTDGALAGKTLVSVAAGMSHACALDDAGAAYCWGHGTSGELGNGGHTWQYAPVAVDTTGALQGVRLARIMASSYFTCAAADSGDAFCWGEGGSGQLGNGTAAQSLVPVAVGRIAARDLVLGAAHACAVDADGVMRCWGNNYTGQLGDGTYTNSAVPLVVTGIRAVSAGASGMTSCALRADGSAACWGEGRTGAIGNGSSILSPVPVEVALGGQPLVAASGRADYFLGLIAAPPDAPASVDAVAADGAATITWREPADHGGPIDAYRVTSSPGSVTCTTTDLLCTLSGLSNGTAYTFTVAAHNLAGWGSPSLSNPATPFRAIAAPGAVRGIRVKAGPKKARVTWKPVAGAVSYQFRIRRPHAKYGPWRSVHRTRVVIRHLKPGLHRVGVRAVNAAGTGPVTTARFRRR